MARKDRKDVKVAELTTSSAIKALPVAMNPIRKDRLKLKKRKPNFS